MRIVAITEFVQNGGLLIADTGPGVRDEHGYLLPTSSLSFLYSSITTPNKKVYGKGKAVLIGSLLRGYLDNKQSALTHEASISNKVARSGGERERELFLKLLSKAGLKPRLAVAGFICFLSVKAEAGPYYLAAEAKEVVVDGQLNEPSWQAAEWVDGFRLLQTGGHPTQTTEFAVLFDQTSLYVLSGPEEFSYSGRTRVAVTLIVIRHGETATPTRRSDARCGDGPLSDDRRLWPSTSPSVHPHQARRRAGRQGLYLAVMRRVTAQPLPRPVCRDGIVAVRTFCTWMDMWNGSCVKK